MTVPMEAIVLLAGILALSSAGVLRSNRVSGCLYQDEMWGSEDGTRFYVCLPGTDTAIEQLCRPNKFFVKNSTITGCVPNDLVSTNCIYRSEKPSAQTCKGENLDQPQASLSPNKYYICLAEEEEPVELSCPAGRAFVKQDGYMGCFVWPQWRKIRNCPE